MSETLEELKAIVDNKPDNTASEFTSRFGRCKYYKFSSHGCWYYYEGNNWIPIDKPQLPTRSISDIKLIIDLIESSSGARERYIRNIERQRRYINP